MEVSPLGAMIVDVVDDLSEEEAVGFQDPAGFLHEGKKHGGDVVPGVRVGFQGEAEAVAEVLGAVFTLVGGVGWVVDDDVDHGVPGRAAPSYPPGCRA